MARARLRIEGLREAVKMVGDVGERARRLEPALRAAETRRDLQDSERRRFSTNRGWRRISPEWIARKRRRGLDPRIMRATGRLESILTNAPTGQVRFDTYNAELRWGLPWRSDAFYAAVQAQRGRRAVVIDRKARAAIAGRVEWFIATGEVR